VINPRIEVIPELQKIDVVANSAGCCGTSKCSIFWDKIYINIIKMIDTPFNILLLGNSNVGKSTIMERYLQNKFVDLPKTVSIEKRDTLLDL